jgi:hypothetical protein
MNHSVPLNGGKDEEIMANRRTKAPVGNDKIRVDVEKGVDQLARSVEKIHVSLRQAEQKIEADARNRIRKLRKDARKQLTVLRGHKREADRIVARLSTAGQESWGDLKRAAYRALADARTVADSMAERFRRAVAE